MARRPMSLVRQQALHDQFSMLDDSFDTPSEEIIEAMNASLMNRYNQELTPRERALRSIGA